jgi:hypothetical protein
VSDLRRDNAGNQSPRGNKMREFSLLQVVGIALAIALVGLAGLVASSIG